MVSSVLRLHSAAQMQLEGSHDEYEVHFHLRSNLHLPDLPLR
jgi:hypothetical protein